MNQITWKNETRKVKDLIPADYNPRKISEKERADLEQSLKTWGYVVPVSINIGSRNNTLIGGHQRIAILGALGLLELDVDVRVPSRELTLVEEKELNISLNKMGGAFDFDKLFKDFDIDTLLRSGFGDEELSLMWNDVDVIDDTKGEDVGEDEQKSKKPVLPRMAKGDIYKIGAHRLMCGDQTNENVSKLMGEELADIVYCEPIFNRKEDKDLYANLVESVITFMVYHSKEDAHFFIWCDPTQIGAVQNIYDEKGIENKTVCLWIKNSSIPSMKNAFSGVYQPCVYGTCGTPFTEKKYDKFNEILNAHVDTGNGLHDDVMDLFNIWLVRKDLIEEGETKKPVNLIQKPLRRCSAPGHILLDLFGGDGGTMMACQQMGRRARVMESDPVACENILKRMEKFTGLTAEKI